MALHEAQSREKHAPSRHAIKLVAMGGGTGLSTILKGLKHYDQRHGDPVKMEAIQFPVCISDMTAVVTVTDDGGSSGRLRKEFHIPPPGDIRNCIVALSEDEALLSKLFQYRFPSGEGLEGHNFGNLFVAALTAITGDFSDAVKLSSAVLNTRGQIFPCTTSDVQLDALMDDGSHVRGETKITASKRRVMDLRLVPASAQPLPQVLEAIATADVITVGPGSLFTSLIPNLLVQHIPETIAQSSAIKVFICNLMTQANESLGMTAADHLRAINDHCSCKVFDYAFINTQPVPEELRSKYAEEGGYQIVCDAGAVEAMGVKPVLGNFLEVDSGVARHSPERVAQSLFKLVHERRQASAVRTPSS